MRKLGRVQVTFLEIIRDNPGIDILKIREDLNRTVSLETDRQSIRSLLKQQLLESPNIYTDSFQSWKLYCTTKSEEAIEYYYSPDSKQKGPKKEFGKCDICSSKGELIKFKGKDLCGQCLCDPFHKPEPITLVRSNFII